ncbi:DUF3016 domain-containing protein [Roseateles koreensis]|uniref:DUF3016 domain-containing protein n=1 Tax=Roseateles koreensis TaxID=2987526 RepID=A0ABT5KU26_9BURK|nr:DUF3016 domain-containing protein [Roseateles koreensis]MDC8785935.1 DUF3016 domain-containing protein [Roseateles koreensis]
MKTRFLIASMLALCGAFPVCAAVEVRFVSPEKFSDINFSAGDREQALRGLQSIIRELGEHHLPGYDLVIDVNNVDLAGEVRPVGRNMDMVRVMSNVTSPAIDLSYVLSAGGKVLRSGQANLRDMNYMDGIGRIDSSESLRYEKKMLDDWFAREFKSEISEVKAHSQDSAQSDKLTGK